MGTRAQQIGQVRLATAHLVDRVANDLNRIGGGNRPTSGLISLDERRQNLETIGPSQSAAATREYQSDRGTAAFGCLSQNSRGTFFDGTLMRDASMFP